MRKKSLSSFRPGATLGTRVAEASMKYTLMPRKKLAKQDERLSYNIIIRVPEKLFKKLDKLRPESRCPSNADVCRRILTNQKIRIYQQDASLNPAMKNWWIRKELKSTG